MIFLNNNTRYDKKTSVALGIFDGVHLGHRAILKLAKKYSSDDTAFGVFTFKSSSVEKKHGEDYSYIYTDRQKEELLESLGTEVIFTPKIRELMDMSGKDFAGYILKEKFNAAYVICGERFRFGKGAGCGADELEEFGRIYGFEVKRCPTVLDGSGKISSAAIKEHLKSGEIPYANKLLGKKYFIESTVKEGNRIGRTISFPTANQLFEKRQVIPAIGCYASVCTVDGKKFPAVTNIGVKPTVEKNIMPLAETHILGFEGDIYGKMIKTELSAFIRAERKFSSLEALKQQIKKDVLSAEKLLK